MLNTYDYDYDDDIVLYGVFFENTQSYVLHFIVDSHFVISLKYL